MHFFMLDEFAVTGGKPNNKCLGKRFGIFQNLSPAFLGVRHRAAWESA